MKPIPQASPILQYAAHREEIVEAIRGVQSSEVLKQLMERGLVRIGGEDDSLGRPYLYETTRKFLEMFGLQSLNDLPMADSLRRIETPNVQTAESALSTDDVRSAPTAEAA